MFAQPTLSIEVLRSEVKEQVVLRKEVYEQTLELPLVLPDVQLDYQLFVAAFLLSLAIIHPASRWLVLDVDHHSSFSSQPVVLY